MNISISTVTVADTAHEVFELLDNAAAARCMQDACCKLKLLPTGTSCIDTSTNSRRSRWWMPLFCWPPWLYPSPWKHQLSFQTLLQKLFSALCQKFTSTIIALSAVSTVFQCLGYEHKFFTIVEAFVGRFILTMISSQYLRFKNADVSSSAANMQPSVDIRT